MLADTCRFKDEYEVEVASRVARIWDDDDNHDPEANDIAETVLKVRLSACPQKPALQQMQACPVMLCGCRPYVQCKH